MAKQITVKFTLDELKALDRYIGDGKNIADIDNAVMSSWEKLLKARIELLESEKENITIFDPESVEKLYLRRINGRLIDRYGRIYEQVKDYA